ncbi:MAG: hypothetical protein RLZZ142_683 [Verrucomicrobiota bacterium]
MKPSSRSPLRAPLSRLAVASLAASLPWAPITPLLAVHSKNAGPESFEIRFKLPVPKPLSPEEELATFKLAPGFRAELVAAEPLVESPVALAWDEKGRLFVCEMRGYMHDIEAAGEDQRIGRISRLEDTDGDGKMDRKTVFADGLLMPRAIACIQGGLLVAEPPNLWFMKDTDGDGIADSKEGVDDSYGTEGGQPEHMANSPLRALDNWIYSANHPKRYRLKDGKFLEESIGIRGQWGMAQDDFGRLYFNSNSDFLRTNPLPESLAKRNPNFTPTAGLGIQVLKDQSTWPSHPTPGVNRGYEVKQLREDGSLAKCTATCGASIYRGTLFPKEFRGNAFIPEPAGNLVKRAILSEKNGVVSGANAAEGTEFWTSTDERFRPVSSYSGPDGALYVVDLYRGIIQHKSFLTHYLIANIKDRQLETPVNQGRIWRIVPDKGPKAATPKIPAETPALVKLLQDGNGWTRDTAQRLLVEAHDPAAPPLLAALAKESKSPLARIHSLWTLEGMGAVSPEVISPALKDPDARVRATAVRLAPRTQLEEIAKLINDPSIEVRVALGFQLSSFPESATATLALARSSGNQELVREAILSGLRGRELETLQALLETPSANPAPDLLAALAQAVMGERRKERVKILLGLIAQQNANSSAQTALLKGAGGKAKNAKGPAPRLLYLDAAPEELSLLRTAANPATETALKALDSLLAWPGKPGVPPPPVVKPLTPAETALFETGKGIYNTLCAGCHQPTGVGMEGLAPALVDSDWVLGNPDLLPRILLHGLAGPIKVNGQSWNLEMPPLGAALSDEQIAGVLTYIRRQWEHTASPVSVAQVAKIRKDNASRTRSWTGEELKALNPKKDPKKDSPTSAKSSDAGEPAGSPGLKNVQVQ